MSWQVGKKGGEDETSPAHELLLLVALPSPAAESPRPTAQVVCVVDGDTVVVRLDGRELRVRLIGVDAPESVDPRQPVQRFADGSAEFLEHLSAGRRCVSPTSPRGPGSTATAGRWRTSTWSRAGYSSIARSWRGVTGLL